MARDKSCPGWLLLFGFLVLCCAARFLYSTSLSAPFYFDDYPNIVNNRYIHMDKLGPDAMTRITDGPSALRPLAMLTFALNYRFHQNETTGYRLVNILIHVITTLLVFALVKETLTLCHISSAPIPIAATLVWFVHPLHTQSITYIVQRMNLLAAMFSLLTLLCYIKARQIQTNQNKDKKNRSYALFILAFFSGALGIASKPIAATLPLSLFLYEFFFFQKLSLSWLKQNRYWVVVSVTAFIMISFIFLGPSPIATILDTYKTQPFTMGQRLLTEPQVVVYYLSLIIYPHPARLKLLYDFPFSTTICTPATTALALFSLVMLVIGGLALGRRHKFLSFAIFWFLITLAIESSFIGLAPLYEYRTYLPSIFPVAAVSALIYKYLGQQRHAAIICILLVAGSIWTIQRNHDWAHKTDFWQDVVAKSPNLPEGYNNLGMALRQAGNDPAAINQFAHALKLMPNNEGALVNLALTLAAQGRTAEAINHLQQALLTYPDLMSARLELARLLFQDIQIDRALILLRNVASYHPNHFGTNLLLGQIYNKKGRPHQAIGYLKRALAAEPTNETVYIALGRSYALANDLSRAAAALQQAIRLQPQSASAYNDLGNVMAQMGRTNEAQRFYRQALQLQPRYKNARRNLANLCVRTNHIDQAIHHFTELVKTSRKNPELLFVLGTLYEKNGDFINALNLYQKLFSQYPAARPFLPSWTAVMP